ncbi:MAG: hypothetical protein WCS30_13480 [Selenomonadaceae bacterium]
MKDNDCESFVFAVLMYGLSYKLTAMSYVLLAANDYTALPMATLAIFFMLIGICKDNIDATIEITVTENERPVSSSL